MAIFVRSAPAEITLTPFFLLHIVFFCVFVLQVMFFLFFLAGAAICNTECISMCSILLNFS